MPADLERLLALVREGDVLVQGYRSGTLARYGLSPERPGIVYVSVNCYGHVGPCTQRPGWDQLGVVATGVAMRQGSPARPQLLPADLIQECISGFGRLCFFRPVARMSLTPIAWTLPAVPLGTHPAE